MSLLTLLVLYVVNYRKGLVGEEMKNNVTVPYAVSSMRVGLERRKKIVLRSS
jgi:hypothetical protein